MNNTSASFDDGIATIHSDYEQTCSAFTRMRMAATQRMSRCDRDRSRLVFAHLDSASVLQNALHDVLVRHHLTNLQFKVLLALKTLKSKPVRATMLAELAGVSKTAITNTIDVLEKNGLAERWRKPDDQRITQIRLTTVGRTQLEEALDDYLQTAANAARQVEEPPLREALALFLSLKHGAANLLCRRTDRVAT